MRNGADKQLRADILADIYLKYNVFINAIRNDQNYNNQENVQRLLYNWDGGVTVKEIGNLENDAAYVINKQHMSFCLQDNPYFGNTKSSSVEDTNLLSYVGIHELAHVMSNSIDHGPEFIKNFKFLLNYSKGLIYTNPITKKLEPVYIELSQLNTDDNYCGVLLTNSIK